MKTIWKFPIKIEDSQTIVMMPVGAKILCVQAQYGEPQVWAIVDPSATIEKRLLHVFRTGQQDINPGRYIGTFQIHQGQLVFHVFED